MAQDFAAYPHALRTTLEVAERCNVEIELGQIRLPKFPVPEGRDAFDYLVELCEKGLQKRYDHVTPEIQERLKFELKTIKEMGFADYFLIVWDFVKFSKQNGVSVGPGRGSTAGSLAAYCLDITEVDPIKYDLLFERFLNPGRKSMPDMDIDFSVAGRDRVINYVAEKYGRDHVAQIITFGTMMARAAVRDAGRVLDVPYGTVDKIAKLIPEGVKVYLDDCLKPGSELKAAYDGDPQVKEIVDLAKPLEGLVRQDSIHAAGVVIGDRPLTEYVPLQRKGEGEETVTQFGMWDVEALGLLKMDFLGLRNLDVIDKTFALVGGGLDVDEDPARRPQDLRDARARRGGRRLPVRVVGHARGAAPGAPDRARGPDRARRPLPARADAATSRNTRSASTARRPSTYIDPRLEPILSDDATGSAVYQEQYMEIAKQLAGFSPAEADDLRKAIGKKIHELMASLKEKFLEGCAQNGVTPSVANQLWKDMEASQDYSFNKSHAAGYALIAYRTAWLRANHPREYMAALISSVMNTKDRVPIYVNACHEMGIEVEPPDVNCSEHDFAVVEGKIRFGLNAVKNVGDSAARAIVAARADGGAVHVDLGLHRAGRPAGLEQARARGARQVRRLRLDRHAAQGDARGARRSASRWGGRHQADRLAGQGSIFDLGGGGEEEARPQQHPPIPPGEYEKNELLRLEKETLGVYVSEHPLQAIREQLRRKTECGLAEVEKRRDGEVVTVGGLVGAIKQLTTKKGDPMVFMRLDDLTGSTEVVVFNSVYAAARELLELDTVLVVKGRVDHKQEGETKMIALEVSAFEATPERREVTLKVDATRAPAGIVRELAGLVREYPGEIPVIVALTMSAGEKTLQLGPDYRVKPDPDFFAEVKSLLGEAAIA